MDHFVSVKRVVEDTYYPLRIGPLKDASQSWSLGIPVKAGDSRQLVLPRIASINPLPSAIGCLK